MKIEKFRGHKVGESPLTIDIEGTPNAKNVRIDNPEGALNNDVAFIKVANVGSPEAVVAIHQLEDEIFVGGSVSSGTLPGRIWQPLQANFFGIPLAGAASLTVYFFNTTVDDDDEATAYAWDFGDGNTSTDEYPVNVYAVAGTYTVTLIVFVGTVEYKLTRELYIKVYDSGWNFGLYPLKWECPMSLAGVTPSEFIEDTETDLTITGTNIGRCDIAGYAYGKINALFLANSDGSYIFESDFMGFGVGGADPSPGRYYLDITGGGLPTLTYLEIVAKTGVDTTSFSPRTNGVNPPIGVYDLGIIYNDGAYDILESAVTVRAAVATKIYVDADTWLRQGLPDANYGSDDDIESNARAGTRARGLMKADLSAYNGQTISYGYLKVHFNLHHWHSVISNLGIYPVNDAWVENVVTWSTQPTIGAVIDNVGPSDVAGTGWATFDITAQIQSWLSGGTNNGVMFKYVTEGAAYNSHSKIDSRENHGTTFDPYFELGL